jgi:hypothetical protein
MVLLFCAVALGLWMVPLGMTLPAQVDARHWPWTWLGLDTLEACSLAATGILTLRRDLRVGAVAGAAAAFLIADAWFDVTTAQKGFEYSLALVLAGGIELPLALLCFVLAWTAPRRFAAIQGQDDCPPAPARAGTKVSADRVPGIRVRATFPTNVRRWSIATLHKLRGVMAVLPQPEARGRH